MPGAPNKALKLALFALVCCLVALAVTAIALRPDRRPRVSCQDWQLQNLTKLRLLYRTGPPEAWLAMTLDHARACPRDDFAALDVASAYARAGRADEAIDALMRAAEVGYDDPEGLAGDRDLAKVRSHPRFAQAAEKVARNRRDGVGLVDPTREMAGLRTVEGPAEGGFRHRLRMPPDTSAAKPCRLLVWLHPWNGYENELVEELAPELARRGFCLLVPTQKRLPTWRVEEARRLRDVTVPAAGRIEGVRAERPVLLGFSAGGQASLALWREAPEKLGAIVVVAAYPYDDEADLRGETVLFELPRAAAPKATPIVAFVGSQDPDLGLWRLAQERWTSDRVELSVEVVPGRGHEWLFDGPARAKLLETLERLPRD